MEDSRLGRFFSVDPLCRDYPFYSSYQFASNNPILAIDLEGLETSDNKNKTETKTSDKSNKTKGKSTTDEKAKTTEKATAASKSAVSPPVEKNKAGETITAVTPQGANIVDTYMGTSIGFGTKWTNPLNSSGEEDFSRDADNESDGNAKKHDRKPNEVSVESVLNDLEFIANQSKVVAKVAENTIVAPYAGSNPIKDAYTGKPISVGTGTKAAGSSLVIYGIVTLKVAVAPAVIVKNVAVATYEGISKFLGNVKTETLNGISSFNNWAPH